MDSEYAGSAFVFSGMISMQYCAKQDVMRLIEKLEKSCIRFIHFSSENEQISRVRHNKK